MAYFFTDVIAALYKNSAERSLVAETTSGLTQFDTGLQDPSVNGSRPIGHILTGDGLWASTTYSYPNQLGGVKPSSPGIWGQV